MEAATGPRVKGEGCDMDLGLYCGGPELGQACHPNTAQSHLLECVPVCVCVSM